MAGRTEEVLGGAGPRRLRLVAPGHGSLARAGARPVQDEPILRHCPWPDVRQDCVGSMRINESHAMPIPHADRAIVDIRKLRDYCLNPAHDEGQRKARVFAAALGLTAIDAEALRAILLEAVQTHEAQLSYRDTYGQRYTVDFSLDWRGKRPQLRSGWVLEDGSVAPRLISCYVL